MRVFLIALLVLGVSVGIVGGGWWNRLQVVADQVPTSVMMPQVIGAEFMVLIGILTAMFAAGALITEAAAEARASSSGKSLGRPPRPPSGVQRIQAALDEGQGMPATARRLPLSASRGIEVRPRSERLSPVTKPFGYLETDRRIPRSPPVWQAARSVEEVGPS